MFFPMRHAPPRLFTYLAKAAALAAIVAACHDTVGVGACFEDGLPYNYALNGDTSLVFRWPASSQPVLVYAEPVGMLSQNTGTAAARWLAALRCGELSIALVTDSTIADVIIRNPSSAPPAPPAGVVLAADSIDACGGRTDGVLDSTNTLTGPLRSYVFPVGIDSTDLAGCYRMVTIHELGHALGILNHSPDTLDIMYSQPRRGTLSPADRVTVQYLYHDAPTIRPQP